LDDGASLLQREVCAVGSPSPPPLPSRERGKGSSSPVKEEIISGALLPSKERECKGDPLNHESYQ